MTLKTKDEKLIGKRDVCTSVSSTFIHRRRFRYHDPIQARLWYDERSERGGVHVDGGVANSKCHLSHDDEGDRVVHVSDFPVFTGKQFVSKM